MLRGGSAGEQWEHPASLSLSFFIFTNASPGSAHFQGQVFLTDHGGGKGWERRKWQKSSTSKPVGKWIDMWTHKGQKNIGWGSLAFNSLSAFPGEDNIIWSCFIPNCISEVFSTFTALLSAFALYTSAWWSAHFPLFCSRETGLHW